MIVKVNAKLSSLKNAPALTGCEAFLMDSDSVSDDQLASGVLQPGGLVKFIFDLEDAESGGSSMEARPDLYVLIKNSDGSELFRSRTHKNVDFNDVNLLNGGSETTLDIRFGED